jgi:hypothetical protein
VTLLRLALPTALVVWFLWKARANPLFLLGIPVLMVMRGSVFFEEMTIFWKPGRFDAGTLLMAWLAFVWVVTVARRPGLAGTPLGPFGVGRILPEELPLVGIALLVGLHALGASATSGDLANGVALASGVSYLVVGYLFVRGIASRATRPETQEFVAAVVVANTIACALFILHQGLHVPVYLGAWNATYISGGEYVSRATVFAPVFNLLALGFVLAKRRWTPGWLLVLAITLMAILVSLTRTLLLAAIAGVVIALVVRELTRPEFGRFARRTGVLALAILALMVGFSRISPAYWSVLVARLGEFTSGQGSQVQNWHLRMLHWSMVEKVVAKGDLLLGLGFTTTGTSTVNPNYVHWTADMTWLPILYMFGFAGLVLFGLLVAGFMLRTFSLSLRPPELRRELCLTYFITLALTVIMAFQMWTFMQPSVYAMGLWIFAFAAVEALRPADEAVTVAASSQTGEERALVPS